MAFLQKICKPIVGGEILVKSLLQEAHSRFDIVYNGFFANHLSHALCTLYSLGGTKTRINEFYGKCTDNLEPLKQPQFVITSENWKEHIGNDKAYSEYLQFFDSEISKNGEEAVFEQYFPQVMGYAIGDAFHPLIHIGFGMEYKLPTVLSEGLAYACKGPLLQVPQILNDAKSEKVDSSSTIVELLEELRTNEDLPQTIDESIGNFHFKMAFILQNYGRLFTNLVARWTLSENDDELNSKLNELTEASILGTFATYNDKIDFFLVHGTTVNHAVRSLIHNLKNQEQKYDLLRTNLLGLLAAYVVQKRPKVDPNFVTKYKPKRPNNKTTEWETIVALAISRDEEHIGKVVNSLISYMENVQEEKRSLKNDFIKDCASKAVDILEDIDDYVF